MKNNAAIRDHKYLNSECGGQNQGCVSEDPTNRERRPQSSLESTNRANSTNSANRECNSTWGQMETVKGQSVSGSLFRDVSWVAE